MVLTIRRYAVAALLVAVAGCTFPELDPLDAGPADAPVTDADLDAPPPTDARTMATVTVIKSGTAADSGAVTAEGIDCGADCSTEVALGTLVTLTRAVVPGVTFTGWSGVCNDTMPTCSFTVNDDVQVGAAFAISQHTITIVPAGNGTGTTTASVGGINCPGTCTATVDYNTPVRLTATPTGASTFAGWNDVGCSGTAPCDFVVTQDVTIDAPYALDFTVIVARNGNGHGTVTGSGINCGTDCDQVYPAGTSVTLMAAADADSDFTGWSGGGCTGTQGCTVLVNSVVSVTANFTLKRYPLTVARNGTGMGTVASEPAGIDCGATCTASFDHGQEVTLTATEAPNSTFTGWSDASCPGTAPCVLTITAARSVTATFAIRTYTLTFDKLGGGVGTVSSMPAGITCGTACTTTMATFTHGQSVDLSQMAGTDSQFVAWGGDCSGASCTLLMTANHGVTGNFKRTDKLLTVNLAGNGAGTVTSLDGGINLPGDGSQTYPHDASVTLTATPNATTSDFTGWTGGGCGLQPTCTVTMSQALTVTATFALKTYTLTFNKAGAGTGTVTSTPAGISCNAACTTTQTATFNHGQVVDLTHTLGADSTFGGYSGACTGTSCSLMMTANRSVTATFARTTKTLTVSIAGNSTGTVTSVPGGINAPTDTSEAYAHNTSVDLTAAWNTTSTNFTGWSGGGCTGTAPTCTVLMDQAQNVTATFTLKTYTLTVTKAGAGIGTVTSTPAGISCGTTCTTTQTATFNHGQPVDLSHSVGTDSTFGGYSGACTGASCALTMTGDRSVTVTFGRTDKTLNVSLAGNGSGTVVSNDGGIMVPGDGAQTYPHGTTVVLTAAPNMTTSDFGGWNGGGCTGTQPTCSVLMDQVQNVTATFTLKTYTLTFSKTGLGTGSVTSTPAGINCGTTCTTTQTATFNHGQNVSLSQTVGPDSTFVGWGVDCSGASCSVLMTADHTVTAVFARTNKTLNVSIAGAGTVTSNDGGINAPTDGTQTYPHNTAVTLTANWNNTLQSFVGWSGDGCSGTATTCPLTMDQTRNVTATFQPRTVTLTVAKNGFGTGTVASVPAGIINCGGDCMEVVNAGTSVTLRATPTAGDIFYGWSGGGCTGTGDCVTTVTAATTVTATFDQCNRTLAESCTDATSFYEACSTTGQATLTMTCPLGCSTTSEKCMDVNPSNGLASYLDMTPTGPDVTFGASSTINTTTGGACNGGSCDAFGTPAGPLPTAVVNGMRVFMVRSLNITGTVKVSGTRPLVFLVHGDVNITGILDVSADGGADGPGAMTTSTTCRGTTGQTVNPSPGGGGGGRSGNGAPGGASGTGILGGAGGASFTDTMLVPLQGGCNGGGATQPNGPLVDIAPGGGGGGSVQIVSRSIIRILNTGKIDASGGGGQSTPAFIGGGGGGSGGGILLEAPLVQVDGSDAVLSTKGAGGAGACSVSLGSPGSDGGTGPGQALGGSQSTLAIGGRGGDGSLPPTTGGTGQGSGGDGGGGGGAAGITVIHTAGGSFNTSNGGAVRSALMSAAVARREIP